jgi:hypothetical protein
MTKPEFADLDFVGNDVFLRESDLVIEVENDYFLAERVKSEETGCACENQSTTAQGSTHNRIGDIK